MQTLGLDRAFFNVTMTMILQPTLEGEMLFLRPTTPEDREPLFTVASDREIWAMHPMHNRWQRPVFDAFFDDGLSSGGALTVIDKSSGKIIGSSRYGRDLAGPDAIEIGWTYLARSHWGGRYNAEMKRLMIVHALQYFDTICFMVGESNLRSRRAMEKIGARLIDRTYDKIAADGIPVTHVIYEINADSFEHSILSAHD
jgi:N-acetyltransferase